MVPTGLTGSKLVQRLGLFDDDIIDLAINGIPPYSAYWGELLPPGSEKLQNKIFTLTRRKSNIEAQYPAIENNCHDYDQWRELMVTGQTDSKGKVLRKKYNDGTTSKLRVRYERICAEIDHLEKKLSWKHFRLPRSNEERTKIKDMLLAARYKMEDIIEFERRKELKEQIGNSDGSNDHGQVEDAKNKAASTTKAVNFITRGEDKHWRIGFEGQECIIDPLDGVYYIALLLDKEPGTPISCRELVQTLSGKKPNNAMSQDMAIAECLHIETSKQHISTPEAKSQYMNRYMQLENDLLEITDIAEYSLTPEQKMEKEEIEKEMADIKNLLLRDRTFADPNDKKAQANIKKRLDKAYKAIQEAGLKKLAKHLQNNIKPDGVFGLSYTGTLEWEITIK